MSCLFIYTRSALMTSPSKSGSAPVVSMTSIAFCVFFNWYKSITAIKN